jgi:hypothetical protein
MDHPKCGKCSREIDPTWGYKCSCHYCGQVVHQSCWSSHPYPHCPICGGLSYTLIRRLDKHPVQLRSLIHKTVDEKTPIRLGEIDCPVASDFDNNVKSMDELERRSIRGQLVRRKRIYFVGGMAAVVFAVLSFAAIAWLCSTYTAPVETLFSVICGIALGGVAAGGILAKHCFSRALAKSRFQTPVELAKRFYEEALDIDPNPEILLELLHPATVKSLGHDARKLIQETWRDIREECEKAISVKPAYWHIEVLRVEEDPTGTHDRKTIEATVAVSCWKVNKNFRPTRPIGHLLLGIRNRSVKTQYGWVLVYPYPIYPVLSEVTGPA